MYSTAKLLTEEGIEGLGRYYFCLPWYSGR